MAFLWKSPNSKYWIARYTDVDRRRRNNSTKIPISGANPAETSRNRSKAQKIADTYELASRQRMSELQVRRVIMSLAEEINGVSLSEKSLRLHINDWLARKQPEVATATMQFYTSSSQKFLKFMEGLGLADRDIASVTREHITAFRNERSKQVQAKTVNHEIKTLKTIFKEAKRDRLITDDPTEFVQTVKGRAQKDRRPFTIDELKALLAVANDEWKSMIMFALYTGQRIGDIAKLSWRNIYLKESEIRIVTTKTGKRLIIPIAEPLMQHIETLPVSDDPDQPIHPDSYKIITEQGRASNLSNKFANLLYDAGLRNSKVSHRAKKQNDKAKGVPTDAKCVYELSFHSLRHTAVTMLHEAGVPAAVVQQLIGHDNDATHSNYIGVGREACIEATKKFPNILTL